MKMHSLLEIILMILFNLLLLNSIKNIFYISAFCAHCELMPFVLELFSRLAAPPALQFEVAVACRCRRTVQTVGQELWQGCERGFA